LAIAARKRYWDHLRGE
jgi:hypothetical protein